MRAFLQGCGGLTCGAHKPPSHSFTHLPAGTRERNRRATARRTQDDDDSGLISKAK